MGFVMSVASQRHHLWSYESSLYTIYLQLAKKSPTHYLLLITELENLTNASGENGFEANRHRNKS